MVKDTIFYSWQSDLPNKYNRNFIKSCIEKAVKDANRNDNCLEVDRDTNGVAGFPNIQQTILRKIESANIFVADISIINKSVFNRKRRTPNPNVLFELGFAVKVLGWERIICVFNEDYGEVNDLPFDIKQHRIIAYSFKRNEKTDVKNQVSGAIKNTLQILTDKGLLYTAKEIPKEYLIVMPIKDVLLSSFVDGGSMVCDIDSNTKINFYISQGSQGEWHVSGSHGNKGFNFLQDFSIDIDYEKYRVQISCVDLDEDGKKEIFVSIGNGSSELETLIYYFVLESNRMFELCGRLYGQEKMFVDINAGTIRTPYGGQGLYEEYKFWNKKVWHLEPDARNKLKGRSDK